MITQTTGTPVRARQTVAAWFDQNVADFKALFAANPALVTKGQFQLTQPAYEAVGRIAQDEVNAMNSVPISIPIAVSWALEDYAQVDGSENPATIRKVLEAIKTTKSEAHFPKTLKAFGPDPSATVLAASLFQALWGPESIPARPQIGTPTAEKVLALRRLERSACYTATMSMARRCLRARRSPVPYKGPPFAGLIANAQLTNEPKGRQRVSYPPAALKDAVGKIGDAIARGYVYVAGVLSGANHTNVGKTFPDPEHWLLLFAYDGATRFIFWDSDSAESNIKSRKSGTGFGLLYYIDGHFSTAVDQTDFDGIDNNGDHTYDPQRHRYQVYLAKPLP